jgi:hypothetical protein
MKKSILLTFIIAALFSAAASANTSGEKETRNVKNFTKVSFGVSGNLYINFGQEFNLTLEGDKDYLDEIITEVSNGRLVIKKENRSFSFDNEKVTVHITMPVMDGLSVSGSGHAEIVDAIKDADRLEFGVSGSGKLMVADVTADKMNCNISGSGNIVISGKGNADNGEITISGSGNYTGEQMEIDHLSVRVSGSGNCTCRAGDSLEASISGSGDVYYLGDPKVDARVSGSGKVRSR